MTPSNYIGAILAAGRGSRMAPFSENFPKPMLPICNRPLIQRQIEIMKSLGITEIVILVGHKGYEISKVLGDGSAMGVSIRYVEQTSTLGIAHAVGRLEPHISRPFLLFLGDIYFVPGDLRQMFRLFEEQSGGAVLCTKEEKDPDAIRRNFSITLSQDGFATRVVEKPRHTTNNLKGVGIYLFDLTIFDAIRRTPRTAMRDEYEITEAIQVLIQDGHPVRPSNSVIDDVNLTVPADLLRCNLMSARGIAPELLIGTNSVVNSSARLRNCVVGNNVVIKNPVEISNSVIFDGSHIDSTADFENFIVTPEIMVDCNSVLKNGNGTNGWAIVANAHV
jgi:glucose-1-phosphate thymidylyltransferase